MEKSDIQIYREAEIDRIQSGKRGNNILQIFIAIIMAVIFFTMENPMEGLMVLICALVTLHILDNRVQTESKLLEMKQLQWLIQDIFIPDETSHEDQEWSDAGRGASGYLNRIYRYLEIIEKKLDKI